MFNFSIAFACVQRGGDRTLAMKLESEFRFCRDRHSLEQAFQQVDRHLPACYAATWVKLGQPPTAFSADEALLLCQVSETEWMAWVPDHGEILLTLDQICEF